MKDRPLPEGFRDVVAQCTAPADKRGCESDGLCELHGKRGAYDPEPIESLAPAGATTRNGQHPRCRAMVRRRLRP